MANELPPLPEGFTVDQESVPALPEGFTLDQPRSSMQEIGRQVGLTVRHAIEGGSALAGLGSDALKGIGNVLFAIDDKLAQLIGTRDTQGYRFRTSTAQEISKALTDAGLPIAETETEELVGKIGRTAAGAATGVGAGQQLARSGSDVVSRVGNTLATQPTVQAISSATGPITGEIAKQAGAGPIGQTVAELAGAVTPGLVTSATQATVRGAIRGGEQGRQRVQENLETFSRAGTTPSVGQATERRVARATESLLERAPGGAGPMVRKAESQADELAANIERRASQLMRRTSAEQAGRQIERDIRGAGGFIANFRRNQDVLYGQLDQFIPPHAPVSVANTRRVLTELTTPIPGAEATSGRLINQRIANIADDLSADAAGGALPYEAVRRLRTMVGEELNSGLVSDVPAAQWRRIYGALSEDLGEAAQSAGRQATAAWTRANNYTRVGMRRIEAIESVIDRNGGPEAIFRAATSGTKEGATTLRSVMQSLSEQGQRTVSATVLRRLGLAKAGVQGELGDRFSTESFLTNWNMLSPEAKRTLFDRYGHRFRSDMDAVSRVAANLREGSQVFRNPSGTAQAQTQAATAGAFALSILTGQTEVAATITATVGGANLTGRLMTNPNFVRWLAQSTRQPIGAYNAAINNLVQRARETEDEDLAQAAVLLSDGAPSN